MSQAVTVSCPTDWGLGLWRDVIEETRSRLGGQVTTSDEEIQINSGDGTWYLAVAPCADSQEVAAEYLTNEDLDSRFRSQVAAGSTFFWIRFNDVAVARVVLHEIAGLSARRGDTAWIDTDYGWVISTSELLERLESNPDWDWRFVPGAGA